MSAEDPSSVPSTTPDVSDASSAEASSAAADVADAASPAADASAESGAAAAAPAAEGALFAAAAESACVKCKAMLATGGLAPFSEIKCPACGADNVVPAAFERFILTKRLGAGGMGSVYLAQDTSLGRGVAIKMLQKTITEDQTALEGLRAEAQNAARLNHPNVAQIYSFGQINGTPYLEMEFVPGQSLNHFVTRGVKLDPAFIMRVGLEIAEGLKAAETAGLFHGDIKPDNILFDSEMKAKLVDFGIASLANQGKSDELWGTPYYIAPEKIQKKKNSARSDIYSLGATLYHAIAGEPPYEGEDAAAVIKARFKGPPRPLEEMRPGIEPEVVRIVSRMMNNDLFMRYPNYNSLINDIKAYLAPIPAIRKQGPARTQHVRTGNISTGSITGDAAPAAAAAADGAAASPSAAAQPARPGGKKFVIQKGTMEAQSAISAMNLPPMQASAPDGGADQPVLRKKGGGASGLKIMLATIITVVVLAILGGVGALAWVISKNSNETKLAAELTAKAKDAQEKYFEIGESIPKARDYVKARDNDIAAQVAAISAVYKEATGNSLEVPDFEPPAPKPDPAAAAAAADDAAPADAAAPAAEDAAAEPAPEPEPEPEPAPAPAQPASPLDAAAERHVFAHAKTIRAALRRCEALAEIENESFPEIKSGLSPEQTQAAFDLREKARAKRAAEAAEAAALKKTADNALKEMRNGVARFRIDARPLITARENAAKTAAAENEKLRLENARLKKIEDAKRAAEEEAQLVRDNFASKARLIEKFDYARAKREMLRMQGELKNDLAKEELDWTVKRLDRLESLREFLIDDIRKKGAVRLSGIKGVYEIKSVSEDGKKFVTSGTLKELTIDDMQFTDWIPVIMQLLERRQHNRSIGAMELGEQQFNAALFCHTHGAATEHEGNAFALARSLVKKALESRTKLQSDAPHFLPAEILDAGDGADGGAADSY